MQRDEQVTTLFQSFLAKTDRKAVKMKPDGNCFYRAISYELFGTEEEDSTIRSVILRTERLNKDVFCTFLMPAGSMEEHCVGVGTPGTWATQVEVVATATIFRVPVYFCTITSNSTDCCRWNVIHPLNESKYELRYPVLPDLDKSIALLKPDHFELLYYENCHYDAIVSIGSGKVCLTPPTLLGCHSELIEL